MVTKIFEGGEMERIKEGEFGKGKNEGLMKVGLRLRLGKMEEG